MQCHDVDVTYKRQMHTGMKRMKKEHINRKYKKENQESVFSIQNHVTRHCLLPIYTDLILYFCKLCSQIIKLDNTHGLVPCKNLSLDNAGSKDLTT